LPSATAHGFRVYDAVRLFADGVKTTAP
jgi:hypothetical protein